MNLTAGTVLQGGKYLVNRVLGQGLSKTLKVVQSPLNRAMVLKTINFPQTVQVDTARLRQAFMADAQKLGHCQHPGLVSLVDLFEEAETPFAVMDFIAGQSLAELVQAQGRLPEAEALHHIRQIGSVLSALHRQGLVHQDVKPQNLIRPVGADFVVLVDYGFAQREILQALDAAGAIPLREYAAPEVMKLSNALSPTADIYGLAASLYFLVTGQKPTAALLQGYSPLVAPRQLQPNLSLALEQAILAGMALNSGDRPQTIAAWFSLLPDHHNLPVVSGFASAPVVTPLSSLAQPSAPPLGVPLPTNEIVPVPILPALSKESASPAHTVAIPVAKKAIALPTNPGRKRGMLLLGTLAAIAGASLGLTLRIGGATGPGSSIFHAEQAFPPLPDWSPTVDPTDPTAKTTLDPPEPQQVLPASAVPARRYDRSPTAPAAATPAKRRARTTEPRQPNPARAGRSPTNPIERSPQLAAPPLDTPSVSEPAAPMPPVLPPAPDPVPKPALPPKESGEPNSGV